MVDSDKTQFINNTMKALAEEYGLKHITIPPYHLQANPVERVNCVLKTMITRFSRGTIAIGIYI